jgi:hypothetical protein
LVLPEATDCRLRKAFASAGLEDAFNALQTRRHRIQQLKESSELEINSLLQIATVLYQHDHLPGMEDYLSLFKTEILDKELEIPSYQIYRILGAARVKAQALGSVTATDKERKLIADMPLQVAYEYSKLNLPQRQRCLTDHLARGLAPSKRSIAKYKPAPALKGGAQKNAPVLPAASSVPAPSGPDPGLEGGAQKNAPVSLASVPANDGTSCPKQWNLPGQTMEPAAPAPLAPSPAPTPATTTTATTTATLSLGQMFLALRSRLLECRLEDQETLHHLLPSLKALVTEMESRALSRATGAL